MIRHGKAIATTIQRATAELAAVLRGEAGQFNVGIFGPLAWWDTLTLCIAEFRDDCPRVSLSISEAPMDRLIADLDAGALDIVIGRLPAIYGRDNYVVDILQQDTPRFVCRRGHPVLAGETVNLEDLIEYPWILAAPPSLLRMQVEHMARDAVGHRPSNSVLTKLRFELWTGQPNRHPRIDFGMHRTSRRRSFRSRDRTVRAQCLVGATRGNNEDRRWNVRVLVCIQTSSSGIEQKSRIAIEHFKSAVEKCASVVSAIWQEGL
ncbi:LysR substrate-binding domain-containing protein [Paraburkholderia sp. IW21]|uniref:LysR substrate-binding domain-containing protein n=1 Tax=Paraburkholderia sp. IW21 TaxID=3242488 RepID=UPI0035221902